MSGRPSSTSPLVTALVAAYNAEAFIGAAIESILAQDWESLEVIVVDDGSVDGTAEAVARFPTVRYVFQANAGVSAARNEGLALSSGEFVAICDSDDLVAPRRFRVQAEYLVANPLVAAVLGRQEWMNPPEGLRRDQKYGELDGIPVGGSAMFRRTTLAALGGYDESLRRGEDTDLLIRIRERGEEYVVLPEVVLIRRFRPDSLSNFGGRSQESILHSLRAKLDRERKTDPGP